MVKFYDSIPPNLVKWIEAQEMFWVASAPLSGDGHVNVSPKGLKGTLHIVNKNQVWYEDITGSGSETMAHIREPCNGRITIMFCGFEGPARIMRFFGHGRAIEFGTPEYDRFLPSDVRHPGSRCAVVIDIHKVSTSCGNGVPFYQFIAHRPTLYNWCAGLETAEREYAARSDIADSPSESRVAEKGLKAYWIKENLHSIDGLPAMKAAHTTTVTPVHAPPRGEWGKDVQASKSTQQSGVGNGHGAALKLQSPIGDWNWNSTELLRLAIAFSLGAIITAVYIQSVGGPC